MWRRYLRSPGAARVRQKTLPQKRDRKARQIGPEEKPEHRRGAAGDERERPEPEIS